MTTHRLALLSFLAVPALIGGLLWAFAPREDAPIDDQDKTRLGLMTSLPIYWNEGGELDGMLSDDQPKHWVRAQLEQSFELVPLDTLATPDSAGPSATLNGLTALMLAQPRALPPADFAALDTWVRDGGKLLMFADPMLTEHSDFAFGDKRRPQDIALMSPILARWGLRQTYNEGQGEAERSVTFTDVSIPVRKVGRFAIIPDGQADCELLAQGVLAVCQIGKGRAVILADAATLEGEGDLAVAQAALDGLVQRSIARPAEKVVG